MRIFLLGCSEYFACAGLCLLLFSFVVKSSDRMKPGLCRIGFRIYSFNLPFQLSAKQFIFSPIQAFKN